MTQPKNENIKATPTPTTLQHQPERQSENVKMQKTKACTYYFH